MHHKLTPITPFFLSAIHQLRNRRNVIWFLISGLVFTVISRLFVMLPPFLFIVMQTTEETVLYSLLIGLCALLACYSSVFFFSLFLVVSRHIALNEDIMLSASLRQAHRSVGRAAWTILLFGLFVFLGLIVLVIPGIVIAIWFFFAPTISVFESKKVNPFKQSKLLMKGRFFAVFFRLVLVYGCVMLPTYLLSFIHPLLSQAWGITSSFFSFVYVLLYMDLLGTAK
ncbi:MAG: hypothetical protein V1917_02215 [Candidatus Gottesmanbacteria bacterium]